MLPKMGSPRRRPKPAPLPLDRRAVREEAPKESFDSLAPLCRPREEGTIYANSKPTVQEAHETKDGLYYHTSVTQQQDYQHSRPRRDRSEKHNSKESHNASKHQSSDSKSSRDSWTSSLKRLSGSFKDERTARAGIEAKKERRYFKMMKQPYSTSPNSDEGVTITRFDYSDVSRTNATGYGKPLQSPKKKFLGMKLPSFRNSNEIVRADRSPGIPVPEKAAKILGTSGSKEKHQKKSRRSLPSRLQDGIEKVKAFGSVGSRVPHSAPLAQRSPNVSTPEQSPVVTKEMFKQFQKLAAKVERLEAEAKETSRSSRSSTSDESPPITEEMLHQVKKYSDKGQNGYKSKAKRKETPKPSRSAAPDASPPVTKEMLSQVGQYLLTGHGSPPEALRKVGKYLAGGSPPPPPPPLKDTPPLPPRSQPQARTARQSDSDNHTSLNFGNPAPKEGSPKPKRRSKKSSRTVDGVDDQTYSSSRPRPNTGGSRTSSSRNGNTIQQTVSSPSKRDSISPQRRSRNADTRTFQQVDYRSPTKSHGAGETVELSTSVPKIDLSCTARSPQSSPSPDNDMNPMRSVTETDAIQAQAQLDGQDVRKDQRRRKKRSKPGEQSNQYPTRVSSRAAEQVESNPPAVFTHTYSEMEELAISAAPAFANPEPEPKKKSRSPVKFNPISADEYRVIVEEERSKSTVFQDKETPENFYREFHKKYRPDGTRSAPLIEPQPQVAQASADEGEGEGEAPAKLPPTTQSPPNLNTLLEPRFYSPKDHPERFGSPQRPSQNVSTTLFSKSSPSVVGRVCAGHVHSFHLPQHSRVSSFIHFTFTDFFLARHQSLSLRRGSETQKVALHRIQRQHSNLLPWPRRRD